jgi:hypothetical protein
MEQSLRDCDIYDNNIRPYVLENLNRRFPIQTVQELPIVASVNIAQKVVDAKANLYKNEPERLATELDEDQQEVVKKIYRDCGVNSQMLWANKYYELQNQTHVKIIPKYGKIEIRPLKNHQVNVIPYEDDPEKGEIYILSSFDKYLSRLKRINSDNQNEPLAEEDDYKPSTMRYVVWSPSYHFVMDGFGNIITEEIDNPISPIIPIVEIATPNKDFEYWKKGGSELSEFTVDYNEQLSMLNQIVELQGFAQAYLKAPRDLQSQSLSIGPHRILRLITDPDNPNANVEFGYANPSSDVANSQDFIQSILSQFLSSQGLDPSLITSNGQSSMNFSSGVERLLAMIDKFESSKETQDIFQRAEMHIYKVVKAWLNELRDTDMLKDEYKVQEIPQDSEMIIHYKRPEAIQTPDEVLSIIERKIDLGLMSRVDAVMELYKVSREDAEDIIREIDLPMEIDEGLDSSEE